MVTAASRRACESACEQIFFLRTGCWAGVEVNFGPLLDAAQHANEKNRGSICMLGWSCSKDLNGFLSTFWQENGEANFGTVKCQVF